MVSVSDWAKENLQNSGYLEGEEIVKGDSDKGTEFDIQDQVPEGTALVRGGAVKDMELNGVGAPEPVGTASPEGANSDVMSTVPDSMSVANDPNTSPMYSGNSVDTSGRILDRPMVIDLRNVVLGQVLSGALLVTEHKISSFKKNGMDTYFVSGNVSYMGCVRPFTIWDSNPTALSTFKEYDIRNKVITCDIKVGDYKNAPSLTLDNIYFNQDHLYRKEEFTDAVDYEGLFSELLTFSSRLTPGAVEVLNAVFGDVYVFDRFKKEYAGQRMHDARIGGLIHHTVKMLRYADTMLRNDPFLLDYKDLLFLGIIFHDIGKVRELSEGQYTVNSFMGHRAIGLTMISKHEELIKSKLGEDLYARLVDIIMGHHGQYNDEPTTVWGYIVHLIDMLESQVTGITDQISSQSFKIHPIGRTVYSNGRNLWV